MNMDMPAGALLGRRILVVEDDYFVAQAISAVLADAGAVVIGPIGWLDEALIFVSKQDDQFDAAVLDVDLHGEKSYPIADILRSRGKLFVFTTGYGLEAIDEKYRAFPHCEKPFDPEVLFWNLLTDREMAVEPPTPVILI